MVFLDPLSSMQKKSSRDAMMLIGHQQWSPYDKFPIQK